MLVLTRRIGETLWVGDSALTLRDRSGDLVLVSLLVPPGTPVDIDGTPAEPAGAMRQLCWHLQWLLCGECLQIGEAIVRVGGADKRKPASRGGQRQLRIAIDAPLGLRVQRAEQGGCPSLAQAVTTGDDTARREVA